jgi:hypothetical protein
MVTGINPLLNREARPDLDRPREDQDKELEYNGPEAGPTREVESSDEIKPAEQSTAGSEQVASNVAQGEAVATPEAVIVGEAAPEESPEEHIAKSLLDFNAADPAGNLETLLSTLESQKKE